MACHVQRQRGRGPFTAQRIGNARTVLANRHLLDQIIDWLLLTYSSSRTHKIQGITYRKMSMYMHTMSKRLDRRFFFPMLLCLRKNFCAWLATCVGVLVVT